MGSRLQVARPPERAVLVFDGECAFCRRWVARWQRVVGDRIEPVPSRRDDLPIRFPELTRAPLDSAVHLIEPDGRVTCGAEAVFRSLAAVWRWPLWLYEHVPGCAALSEWVYRFVARRRTCLAHGAPGH